jgi:protein ImuB
VYGLQGVDDHRAEAAWKTREPVVITSTIQSGLQNDSVRNAVNPFDRRPLWLLSVPRLLGERDGLPRRRGALRLLGEAERIETGWWDGREIARDYYTAVDIRGARLWVFRERKPPHRWFLHGVFG